MFWHYIGHISRVKFLCIPMMIFCFLRISAFIGRRYGFALLSQKIEIYQTLPSSKTRTGSVPNGFWSDEKWREIISESCSGIVTKCQADSPWYIQMGAEKWIIIIFVINILAWIYYLWGILWRQRMVFLLYRSVHIQLHRVRRKFFLSNKEQKSYPIRNLHLILARLQ